MSIINLKSVLKSLKLNESTISMILGAVVIIVVGLLTVNYLKSKDKGETIPSVETTESQGLPSSYTVGEGENLWTIAEKLYGSGYNWVDIAEENNLSDPGAIETGQKLNVPAKPTQGIEPTENESLITITPTTTQSQAVTATPSVDSEKNLSEQTYTVVKGDNLWDICVRAYGDGYRWLEVAKLNNLTNPDLIYPGDVFKLPN